MYKHNLKLVPSTTKVLHEGNNLEEGVLHYECSDFIQQIYKGMLPWADELRLNIYLSMTINTSLLNYAYKCLYKQQFLFQSNLCSLKYTSLEQICSLYAELQ